MNETQVALILALANGHDGRHQPNDVKVRAWFALLTQEAPDMDYDWASEKVNSHYARTTDMLMPAHLVTGWKAHKRYLRDKKAIPAVTGKPMPEWFKEALKEMRTNRG